MIRSALEKYKLGMENLTWNKVYDLPLSLDECSSYAWTKSGVMAIQFNGLKDRLNRQRVVDSINSMPINSMSDYRMKSISHKGCDFYIGDTYVFCVRGWGHLTGSGALGLPEEKALEIQDGFIAHVLKSLQ